MTQAPAQTPGSARILVVDDNEMNRDMLSRRLIKAGYSVETAPDGQSALALLLPSSPPPGLDGQPDPIQGFDLVLLDVMMAGIDGFEVLRRLREHHPATALPVIMATAKDQRDDIVRAFDLGASDYVTKPIDFAVAHARVRTQLDLKRSVDRILALERSLQARNADLDRANQRMRGELQMAARVQQALLPASLPVLPTASFAWTYRPCEELGGDILGVLDLDDSHVGLYLLDVSGHGVPAALLSVTLSRILATVPGVESLTIRRRHDGGFEPVPPAAVVSELNRRFPMDDSTLQYFTLFYGVLNVTDGSLRFVCAGHPPPILIPRDGPGRTIDGSDHAVGWFPDTVFQERSVRLAPGDRLILYSDGISEAANLAGRAFGTPGVLSTLDASRNSPLKHALDDMVRAASGASDRPFRDDVSALGVAFTGSA
ncbi:MAG: SpoIIE family protein phosphatase [Phycisphaeraceae bacterium]|nr:SpoIIE family protein phosphatase [Phycisphaeraceae bacterium]